MKLIHIVDLKGIGGVERLFCDFINYPIQNVKHITVANNGLHPLLYKDVTNSSEHLFLINKYLGNFKIPKYFRSIKEKYIISKIKILNSDLWLFWNNYPTITMYNDILKDKLIYYEHGMAWYDRKLDKKNITFLENVNKIICVSSAAKRVLKLKWGIKNKNIVVCLNALRPSCKPANTSIKTLDKNKVINLGIAGRCESFKGFPLVIHAVKELKKRGISSKLFIAGMGKDFESLKKIAKSLSLVDEVNFLGLVNDMKEFYSNIDVFVFPSLRDPFPLVVIEAMAHGCPVIVAGVDGLYEMVKDTGAGSIIKPTLDISYFPEYDGSLDFLKIIGYVYDPYTDSIITPKFVDPTLIADAVEELWNNSTKFEEMSANAIKAVDKKYNYANYMKNIYTTMEDIISK